MALKNLEQRVLFGFTRGVSLVIVCGLFLAVVIGTIAFFCISDNSEVTYSSIKNQLQYPTSGQKVNNSSTKKTLDQNDIETVRKYFGDQTSSQMMGEWLQGMNQDEQKDFLINLAAVIRQAEQDPNQKYQIGDIINKYKDIKVEKMSANVMTKNIEQYKPLIYMVVIALILGLIGLFSIILVLLAIERNTRKEVIIDTNNVDSDIETIEDVNNNPEDGQPCSLPS
jgi:hypothetical protein